MSQDNQEFTFSYTRKNSENLQYKILYDHLIQKILIMEKTINSILLIREEDNKRDAKPEKEKLEIISIELSVMLTDILKNVEKRTK